MSQYQGDLDGKWEQYLATTPKAEQLTRKNWFYSTKGGTVAAPEVTPTSKIKVEDSDSFAELISSGGTPTAEDIKALASTGVGNLPFGSGWSRPEDERLGNWVNLSGTGYQIVGGADRGEGEDVLYLKGMDGQMYALRGEDSNRQWFEIDKIPEDVENDWKNINAKKIDNPVG
jgi:hypothetical protein